MSENTIQLWSSHSNLAARQRERRNFGTFFCCMTILIGAAFVALVMVIRGGILQ